MNRAPVTRFLVIANTGIHILLVLAALYGGLDLQQVGRVFGLLPYDFLHGAFWQPLTMMFLHDPPWHILFNMIALWSLGTAIEITVGSKRFLLLYLFSGLTASAFIVIFQPDIMLPTVGASGAIAGLLGAIAVFYPRSEMLIFFFPMKARTAAIVIAIGSVLLSIYDRSSGISHLGHLLGGLIGGILYTKFVLQLDFLRNDLQQSGSRFVFRRRVDPHASMEEEVRRMMEQLRQERAGQAERRPPQWKEKEPEPFNEVIRDEPQEPTVERRIYFDPVTGRFYVK